METENTTTKNEEEFEDLELCAKEGRKPRCLRRFRIRIDHNYYIARVSHMTGYQLLELAGKCHPERWQIFQKIRGKEIAIDLDEKVDFTEPGIERFTTVPNAFEIIVNSRPRQVTDRCVSFNEIVDLAFPETHGQNTMFSMTYSHALSKPHAGELGAGGTVKVKEKGTIFNVTKTDKS